MPFITADELRRAYPVRRQIVAPSSLPTLAEMQATRRATPKHEMVARVDEKDTDRRDDEKQLRIWRQKVYRRDKDLCRCCGVKVEHTLDLTAKRAEAHHIKAREHRPTRIDVRNGLTLCYGCHRRVTGMVADKLKVIPTKWFTLAGVKYVNGSAPVTFQKVA